MDSFENVVDFHGHACPGLALGYRVSLRALKEFGRRSDDEELVAVVENSSCGIDAIQVMTGCTFGKGNLIFHDYGKQSYTFIKRPSGSYIRIAVSWEKPAESRKEKALWKRYMDRDRSPEVLKFVHDRKSRRIKQILDAPDKALFKVEKGRQLPPPEASVYRSVRCVSCGEKVMETRARVLEGDLLCIPCFERKTQ